MTERLLGVGEAARRLGEQPGRVSDGFSKDWFDCDRCPLVAGRRLIPEGYMAEMAAILRRRAKGRAGDSKQGQGRLGDADAATAGMGRNSERSDSQEDAMTRKATDATKTTDGETPAEAAREKPATRKAAKAGKAAGARRKASARHELLWRNKWLTAGAKTIDDMIEDLQAAADGLREMRDAGVVLEDDGGTEDDYATLVTRDPDVAARFGFDRA